MLSALPATDRIHINNDISKENIMSSKKPSRTRLISNIIAVLNELTRAGLPRDQVQKVADYLASPKEVKIEGIRYVSLGSAYDRKLAKPSVLERLARSPAHFTRTENGFIMLKLESVRKPPKT